MLTPKEKETRSQIAVSKSKESVAARNQLGVQFRIDLE
jgi:hypothetical protein